MEPQWAAPQFLASDADREHAIEALKQSFQAGRITVEELSERIGHALTARTCGEIDRVMSGLPWQPVTPMRYPAYYAPYTPRPARSKGMGIAAFVLGVFGFLCGFTAVPAVVLGLVALTVEPERRDDRGFAIAGLAVGAMWMLVFGWIYFS
ncbi:DUF1707 and DUF4190 domain-containing protein [Nocardia sp. NPDC059764]|uniref:DUF1707 and DUF4190 domain-containing protein n=1 Tax=Nocardia sp. NPDC059764 TaxID=3346939 RepID=UPI00364F3CE1